MLHPYASAERVGEQYERTIDVRGRLADLYSGIAERPGRAFVGKARMPRR
ncbi:MAG TPA: hypothetical protein VK053_09715 [Jiangellaceae bacterium]|nr:hypothetical protein [Jiangellaceae bacterium]